MLKNRFFEKKYPKSSYTQEKNMSLYIQVYYLALISSIFVNDEIITCQMKTKKNEKTQQLILKQNIKQSRRILNNRAVIFIKM